MGQSWYFTRGNQQAGPVEWEALCAMAASGDLPPNALVWSEGLTQWSPATSITGLMPMAAGPVAAPTVPYGHTDINYYAQTAPRTYAGFWLRFVAAIVDGFIVGVANVVLDRMITGFSSAAGTQAAAGATAVVMVVNTCTNWLYFALFESSAKQATPGKMILSIKVTDMSGGRISFGQATGRYFGKIISTLILLIGYMMAGWTEKKQALHDIMAGCLVIREG